MLSCVIVYSPYVIPMGMIKWFLLEFVLFMDKC